MNNLDFLKVRKRYLKFWKNTDQVFIGKISEVDYLISIFSSNRMDETARSMETDMKTMKEVTQ